MEYKKDISIIVPLFNENESLPELVRRIDATMCSEGLGYELILVDDGSQDGSWESIRDLAREYPCVKGISFRGRTGGVHPGR